MKTKKTIRKLSPLARKAAHLSRTVHGVQRRLDYLTEEIGRVEGDLRAEEKRANLNLKCAEGNLAIIESRDEDIGKLVRTIEELRRHGAIYG